MPRRPNTRPTLIYWLVDTRTNTPFYCGKTVRTTATRLRGHRRRAAEHPTAILSVKIKECGNHIRVQILETVMSDSDWRERERHWIKITRFSFPDNYNTSEGGEGTPGVIPSAETRAKLSAVHRGRKRPPRSAEHCANISAAKKGKTLSPETCAKLSIMRKGRTISLRHRQSLSIALKGHEVSAATRAKLRLSNIGKKYSDEIRAARSITMRKWHENKRVIYHV